jgi:O-antigen ligase
MKSTMRGTESHGFALPPISGGGGAGMTEQLRQQQVRHRRVQSLRTVQTWWYIIVLVAAGGICAAIMGQYVLDLPKEVFGILIGVPLIILSCKRVEIGLVVFAISVSPFVPSALKVSSLYISPAIPLLLLLFFIALVQTAFHVKETVFPSIWTVWPLIGLAAMAVISEIQGQVAWLYGVPHQILGNPIIFEESIGVVLYFIPLLVTFTVSACLTKRDRWLEFVLSALLILALLDAAIILYEFKRIGADIYAFRYTTPSIGWMPLEALAQLLVLGCILAYARVLYASDWKSRIVFGASLFICLIALYFSLENSWWLEAGAGLTVMTFVYSRRLFAVVCVAAIPFLPLVRSFLQKLQSVKSVDALRLTIWQDMLRVWSKRPVMGVGPGNLWAYDQVFTHLPQGLRNFAKSGLGVAHEGYLQTLGELGPLGLFFHVAFIVVFILAAARLLHRSRGTANLEKRNDRILGLVGLGLICGSAAGDLVASYFFLPPRQSLHVGSLPQALVSWVIYGCVLYKDQIWRLASRRPGIAV